jgi:site-specific DNA-cytosine methylase
LKKKVILHLCADIGSDSHPYQCDSNYEVIKIGKEIGVENYSPDRKIHGVIANLPCTEFSAARADGKARENTIGFSLVDHCLHIINEASPEWWVLENPAKGTLKNYLKFKEANK